MNPAAKVRGRNDMADRWRPGPKESSPIAPAEDEAAGATGIVMRRTGSSTQAEHYRKCFSIRKSLGRAPPRKSRP